jgi:putative flippase GtrA
VAWEWVRHHVSAVASTGVDFGTMIAVVELGRMEPVPATAVGALAGAITNFVINRHFTYRAVGVAIRRQLWKYVLVAATSLVWNTAGEYLFHEVLDLQYMAARVITAAIVSNAWNYPLSRFFVFREKAPRAGA